MMLATVLGLAATAGGAEEIAISATLSPTDQIRLDVADGSKRFFLMVRREGVAEGSGPFAGAEVTEFGAHDIAPGIGGDPHGWLVIAAPDGATAWLKWQVRAVFVPGPEGKPRLLDNGFWEVVGGTGRFEGLTGAGTLHIRPASPTDRRFILTGELIRAS